MPYLIGTDEAGYGPNLGPLVITACAWELPKVSRQTDLYRLLGKGVVDTACHASWGSLPLPIADSKVLYKPGQGLAVLERSVLTCLELLNLQPGTWRRLWEFVEPARDAELDRQPWHVDCELALPLAADGVEIAQLASALRACLASAGVRLAHVASRCLFPAQFNELTEKYGNKAEALSRTTLELVAQVLGCLPPSETQIVCDKHGGRNRYGSLLQGMYPDVLIEVAREGRAASTYRWGHKPARCEIHFVAGGERAMPTALASMTSKYLRELSMHAFNTYWRRHVPELRPTAGYPGDARRFMVEIASAQRSLGIADRLLWRDR